MLSNSNVNLARTGTEIIVNFEVAFIYRTVDLSILLSIFQSFRIFVLNNLVVSYILTFNQTFLAQDLFYLGVEDDALVATSAQ